MKCLIEDAKEKIDDHARLKANEIASHSHTQTPLYQGLPQPPPPPPPPPPTHRSYANALITPPQQGWQQEKGSVRDR